MTAVVSNKNPQVCYPANWFAPMPFDAPWASEESNHPVRNWYEKAAHTVRPNSTYRSTMSGCGTPAGCALVGFQSVPQTPISTCTTGPNAEYNMLHFAAGKDQGHGECSDANKCPTFEMCDYRYGSSGKCAAQPTPGL